MEAILQFWLVAKTKLTSPCVVNLMTKRRKGEYFAEFFFFFLAIFNLIFVSASALHLTFLGSVFNSPHIPAFSRDCVL